MIIQRQEDVTTAALIVMEQTTDPRLRQIMVSSFATCTASSARSA